MTGGIAPQSRRSGSLFKALLTIYIVLDVVWAGVFLNAWHHLSPDRFHSYVHNQIWAFLLLGFCVPLATLPPLYKRKS